MHTRAHTHMHACMRADMYTTMHMNVLTRTRAHAHVHACMHADTLRHTCARTCMNESAQQASAHGLERACTMPAHEHTQAHMCLHAHMRVHPHSHMPANTCMRTRVVAWHGTGLRRQRRFSDLAVRDLWGSGVLSCQNIYQLMHPWWWLGLGRGGVSWL